MKLLRQPPRDRRVLVDGSTFDDAGVFALGSGEALVQTVDFFPPIVDDPYDFGRVAAANSLSDVYAMGGRPLTALALLCAPEQTLPAEAIAAVLQGGLDTMRKAGVSVLGGHTVRDPELKFGYAVTGVARRRSLLRNSGAKPGDHVFLTKPLGTGILATALKQGRLDAPLTRRLTEHMATLNRAASEAAVASGAHAATDVTGFGLLGHAAQMADASGVTLELRVSERWLLPRVLELAAAGVVPGGLARNREYYSPSVGLGTIATGATSPPEPIAPALLDAFYDPQTSGGLLVCVPERRAAAFVSALRRKKVACLDAGRVSRRGERAVVVASA